MVLPVCLSSEERSDLALVKVSPRCQPRRENLHKYFSARTAIKTCWLRNISVLQTCPAQHHHCPPLPHHSLLTRDWSTLVNSTRILSTIFSTRQCLVAILQFLPCWKYMMVCTGEPRGDVTLHLHSPLLSSLMSISNETNSNNYRIIKYSTGHGHCATSQTSDTNISPLQLFSISPKLSLAWLFSDSFPQTRKQSCIYLNSIYFLFSAHSKLSADLFSRNLLIFRAVFVFSPSSATLGRNPI